MDEKPPRPTSGHGSENASLPPSESATATDPEKTNSRTFEPIRPGNTAARPASHNGGTRRLSAETIETLRRERSNNGWGCDDIEADAAGGTIAPYNHPGGKMKKKGGGGESGGGSSSSTDGAGDGDADAGVVVDPFEVGWEGGDSDPLCPRSFPTWRKWLIIAITSVGSFCV